MRDRSEYARKGIARGRSVVVLTYAGGVLFVAENLRPSLRKVSEIYDRIGFAAVGRYNEFENLRAAGVRLADLRGYSYDRRDVTGRGAGQRVRPDPRRDLHRAARSRSRWRSASPRSAPDPADDELYRITYDGSVVDEPGFVAMGGQPSPISSSLRGPLRRQAPRWPTPLRWPSRRCSPHRRPAPPRNGPAGGARARGERAGGRGAGPGAAAAPGVPADHRGDAARPAAHGEPRHPGRGPGEGRRRRAGGERRGGTSYRRRRALQGRARSQAVRDPGRARSRRVPGPSDPGAVGPAAAEQRAGHRHGGQRSRRAPRPGQVGRRTGRRGRPTRTGPSGARRRGQRDRQRDLLLGVPRRPVVAAAVHRGRDRDPRVERRDGRVGAEHDSTPASSSLR